MPFRSRLRAIVAVAAAVTWIFGVPDAYARMGDCGHPATSGAKPTATDALGILRAAVGTSACDVCTCDADGSGGVAATDALLVLRIAVGFAPALDCAPCSGAVAPPEVVTRGSVAGYVFQVNPVFVVDDPSSAPPGSTPAAGASVRAYDRAGDLVGQTTTAADGSFTISDLPTGLVELEIRADPGATDPDLTVSATVVPDVTIPLGRSYGISREAAKAIALQGVAADALVAGSLNPFPAGTVAYPKGSASDGLPQNADVETFPTDSWFFFVNLEPLADFTHPVEYVLVDAATGGATRIPAGFPPVVNHGALWDSTDELFRFLPEDLSHLDPPDFPSDAEAVPTAELVQFPELPDDPNPPDNPDQWGAPLDDEIYENIPSIPLDGANAAAGVASNDFNNTGGDGVFVVLLRTGEESHFAQNIGRMATHLFTEGVPLANMAKADMTNIEPPALDTNGLTGLETLDARKAAMRDLVRSVILHFEPQIEARLEEGKHSTLIVYITGHGGGGNMIVDFKNDESGSWGFGAADLGIEATKACRVRAIIQSCSAENFQDDLANVFQATEHDVIVFSASAAGKGAKATPGFFTYVPVLNLLRQGGSHFTTRFARLLDIENGDLASVTEVDDDGKAVLVDDLADLDSMPPDPFVRPSHPSWCFPPECGDGVAEPPEQCDGIDDSACPGMCMQECTCPDPICGNGIIEAGEACDAPSFGSCPTGCSSECQCAEPGCGNNVLEMPEECDGTNDGACPGLCVDDTCECVICGNDRKDPTEDCDGSDDAACPGLCSPQCGCTAAPVCGDGIPDPGEACDGDLFCHLAGSACLPDCTCSNACTTTSDCSAGERCYFERCVADCMGPGDCAAGESCSVVGFDGQDVGGFGCTVLNPDGATVGSECSIGLDCETLLCAAFTRECTEICDAGLSPDSQCAGGACSFVFPDLQTGLCATACSADLACRDDQLCQFSFDNFSNRYTSVCGIPFGAGEVGDACTAGSECDSLFCGVPPAAQSPCFTNADCAALSGTICSPYWACVEPACARFCESDTDCTGSGLPSCIPLDITTPDGLSRQNVGVCGGG